MSDDLKPEDAQAWYNRGVELAQLGQYEDAIADNQTLKIEPDI